MQTSDISNLVTKEQQITVLTPFDKKSIDFATERNITSTLRQPSRKRKQSSFAIENTGQRDTFERVEDPKAYCKRSLYIPIFDKVLSEFRQI